MFPLPGFHCGTAFLSHSHLSFPHPARRAFASLAEAKVARPEADAEARGTDQLAPLGCHHPGDGARSTPPCLARGFQQKEGELPIGFPITSAGKLFPSYAYVFERNGPGVPPFGGCFQGNERQNMERACRPFEHAWVRCMAAFRASLALAFWLEVVLSIFPRLLEAPHQSGFRDDTTRLVGLSSWEGETDLRRQNASSHTNTHGNRPSEADAPGNVKIDW